MKKFTIIGFIIALVIASILLWQHSNPSSDAKLGRQIAGTWTNYDGLYTKIISSDGSFSTIVGIPNALSTSQGTWLVKDGELVLTVTNVQLISAHRTFSPMGEIHRTKIVHVDDHQFSYVEAGRTNTLCH